MEPQSVGHLMGWARRLFALAIVGASIFSTTESAIAEVPPEHARVYELDVPRFQANPSHLDIPIDGELRGLELARVSNRAPNFKVLVQGASGRLTEVSAAEEQTFRGRIEDDAASFATISIVNGGIEGTIELGNGRVFYVEPTRGRQGGSRNGAHFVYEDHGNHDHGVCEAQPNPEALLGDFAALNESATVQAASGLFIAEIACDADYEFYQDWGSVANAQQRIESVINAVNSQFERDVGITHAITTIVVRTTSSDPYASTVPLDLLVEFRNHWNANHGSIARDTAHLFTGKSLDGSTIGIAYSPGICTSYAYGLSESDFSTSFSCVSDLTAHELGHNWNAPHCSCSSYTMNPSITCSNIFSPNTIDTITSFRNSLSCLTQDPGAPPAEPSGLTATATSDTEIQLTWTDNATTESGYDLEQSSDGGSSWSLIATVGIDAESHIDTGLTPSTSYAYRVTAFNVSGRSNSSNIATATTLDAPPPPPETQDILATSDSTNAGTASGNLSNTYTNDGIFQSITERESGGPKPRRHSYLEHVWSFSLPSSTVATLFVEAWETSDEDNFLFEYSTNGGAYYAPAMLAAESNTNVLQAMILPASAAGQFLVRVVDTDQTQGARTLDTVYIDELFVRVETTTQDPPATPTALAASANSSSQIGLNWTDASTDELGFDIERSDDGVSWSVIATTGADATSYVDETVFPNSIYDYRVSAFNSGGSSAPSNVATATTPNGPAPITLDSAFGEKRKGVQWAILSWTGGGSFVDIKRNGVVIATVQNTGFLEDNIGGKGGGSYSYEICDTGTNNCSNTLNVIF